jgi:glutathione synthase/RimK-type ligase-like ATP-grasp enzyme
VALCDDWIFCLQHGGAVTHVVGYDFGLNTATAALLAADKAATSAVLAHAGVACVEHQLVVGPARPQYLPEGGFWQRIVAFWERSGRDVVCKPNQGSGGVGVIRARTLRELEVAVHRTLETNPDVCLSPYLAIAAEYRVVMLDGEPELMFEKVRPYVEGDGESTIQELVARAMAADPANRSVRELLRSGAGTLDVDVVPRRGERVPLGWRHNLAQGARVATLAGEVASLVALARAAMTALDARFASVDLVRVDGALRVLEINAGVMMESYAAHAPDAEAHVEHIYDRAVCKALGIDRRSPSAGGGDPDGIADGAGVLPRGIDA